MTTPCEIPCDIELSPLSAAEPLGAHVLAAALPFLEAVKITVDVRVGRVASTFGDLLALRDGQVLALDRPLDEPLDVLIDGQVVARGTLVAVGEHFGLRLTQAPSLSRAATGEGGAEAPENLDPTLSAVRSGATRRGDVGAPPGEAGWADVAGHGDGTRHAVTTARDAPARDAVGPHQPRGDAARRDAAGGADGVRELAGSPDAPGHANATGRADAARHADTTRHADAARHEDAARHADVARHADAARQADETGRAEAAWQAGVNVPAAALGDRA